MSIFGTPEERKRRQQEQEEAMARAKEKLAGLWSAFRNLPTPIHIALMELVELSLATSWRELPTRRSCVERKVRAKRNFIESASRKSTATACITVLGWRQHCRARSNPTGTV